MRGTDVKIAITTNKAYKWPVLVDTGDGNLLEITSVDVDTSDGEPVIILNTEER